MGSHLPALTFNGVTIHDQGEMLSLTDLWRAAGSPDARRPTDWLALGSTIEFRAAVEVTFNAGISGIETKRGGTAPGTWGHWQIALAYAKYLDPQFHMQCNAVIRERMQAPRVALAESPPVAVAATFKGYFSIGRLIGLDRNQSALAANRATVAVAGVDALALMGATHLIAPQQEPILTSTDIGVRLGGLSGIAVNARLAERGLQEGRRDAKDRSYWVPTAAGEPYAVFLDTGKKHGDGTPVRQLKWLHSVIDLLRTERAVAEEPA